MDGGPGAERWSASRGLGEPGRLLAPRLPHLPDDRKDRDEDDAQDDELYVLLEAGEGLPEEKSSPTIEKTQVIPPAMLKKTNLR